MENEIKISAKGVRFFMQISMQLEMLMLRYKIKPLRLSALQVAENLRF